MNNHDWEKEEFERQYLMDKYSPERAFALFSLISIGIGVIFGLFSKFIL